MTELTCAKQERDTIAINTPCSFTKSHISSDNEIIITKIRFSLTHMILETNSENVKEKNQVRVSNN